MLRTWAAGVLHLYVRVVPPWQILKESATFLQNGVRTNRCTIARGDRSMGANAGVDTWIAISWRRMAYIAYACRAPIETRNGDVEVRSFTRWVILPWALIVDLHDHLSTRGEVSKKHLPQPAPFCQMGSPAAAVAKTVAPDGWLIARGAA